MWQNGQQNIELDGIDIVTKDNTASMTSLFGRKTKMFDGNDKIVRVVQLQTANGFFVRPVSKLVFTDEGRNRHVANQTQKRRRRRGLTKTKMSMA